MPIEGPLPTHLKHPLVTAEKVRGAIAGTITGGASTGLYVLGVALGLSAPASLALMYYLVGGVLAYTMDVMVAKHLFHGRPVPYLHLGARFKWLVASLLERFVWRFVVALVIEALTAVALLEALIVAADRYGVLTEDKWRTWRNLGLAVVVAALVYVLFGNVLRYDWAYNEVEQPTMNIVVMVWVAVTLLVFARGSNLIHEAAPDAAPPMPRNDRSSSGGGVVLP